MVPAATVARECGVTPRCMLRWARSGKIDGARFGAGRRSGRAALSVYRRGKVYWIRFQFAGQEHRRSARTASKAEAVAYERQIRKGFGRVARGGRQRRTYREAMERFLIEHCASLKAGPRVRYISSAKAVHPLFKELYLDQIGRAQLAGFASTRRGAGVATATIRRDLACSPRC
jgi:integrase/recombinase XerD